MQDIAFPVASPFHLHSFWVNQVAQVDIFRPVASQGPGLSVEWWGVLGNHDYGALGDVLIMNLNLHCYPLVMTNSLLLKMAIEIDIYSEFSHSTW